jgi:riboflavin kinase / FMN adenylyltransferase
VEDAGRVLLETHVLDWPQALASEAAYGKCITVELLHKLHDELKYNSLDALRVGISADVHQARAWWDARE